MPKNKKMIARAVHSECPFCQSRHVCYDGVSLREGQCKQEAFCLDCKKPWVEHYTLDKILTPGGRVVAKNQ